MTYFRNFMSALLALLVITAGCNKDDLPQPAEMKLLHAQRGNVAGIYDPDGRWVILRGVNYNALGDYWQGNPAAPTTLTYSSDDFGQMAAYGFNCVRLLFSWSKLQPQQGNIDQNYILQIKQAIEDAGKHNLYVILDMHQDAWGKYIATPDATLCPTPAKGWDGAPEWATITNGASTCTINGQRETAPAVITAFDNFWNNTNNLQSDCMAAWAELVQQTCAYTNLAGYDLLNEPNMGYGTVDEERAKLNAYYANLIEVIRNAENAAGCAEHIIFFEMAVTIAGNATPIVPDANFTTDNNLVFAPHHYFESISNTLSIEMGYNILVAGSFTYSTALWVGEWGFFNGIADTAKIKRFAAAEDARFAGSAWWQWAQAPGDPHGVWWNGTSFSAADYSLHLAEVTQSGVRTGNLNLPFLHILSRTRPNAIAGTPTALSSNPSNGTLHLEANTGTEAITELWIPNRFGTPIISGNNVLEVTLNTVSGGYIAQVRVKDNYSIEVNF